MKFKLPIILLLVIAFFIQSCGDDDMGSSSNSALAGTWLSQSFGGSVNTSSEFGGNTVTTMTTIDGKNLNYSLTLTDDSFTTLGSYDIDISIVAQGSTNTTSDSYTNVNGDGTYSTSGNEMTVNGQFFDLEVNGVPIISNTGPVTATYNISADILTITQNEQSNSSQGGVVTSNETTFISTWKKQ